MAKTRWQDLVDFSGIKDTENDIKDLEKVFKSVFKNLEVFSKPLSQQIKGNSTELKKLVQVLEGLRSGAGKTSDEIEKYVKQTVNLSSETEKLNKTSDGYDKTVKDLQVTIKSLREELKKEKKTLEQVNLTTEEGRKKAEQSAKSIKGLRDRTQDLNRAASGLNSTLTAAAGSYDKLTLETNQLRKELRAIPGSMDRSSVAFKKNRKEIDRLTRAIGINDAKLKRFDKSIGQNFRNVGNYRDALKGVKSNLIGFASALGVTTGAVFILAQAIKETVKINIELSDVMADVRKTTGFTTDEVESLQRALESVNTRTSTNELLKIAEAGGRLGLAKRDILDFTINTDKAFVALGKDLQKTSEEVATDLLKIAGQFGLIEEFGAGEAINKIGSSINELGNNTRASGDKISDFAFRLLGVAPQAGIAVEDILALGAAFDSVGQSPEVAATAVNKFLIEIGKDASKFANILGVPIEEFTRLVEEDAIEAFLQVIQTAGQTEGSLIKLSSALGELGVKQSRSIQSLGALAGGIDEVRKAQNISNKAFEEGTSLTTEFNIKNGNLAGSFDKLKKSLTDLASGSGVTQALKTNFDTLSFAIRFLNDQVNDFVNPLDVLGRKGKKLAEDFTSGKSSTDGLTSSLVSLEKQFKGTTGELTALGPKIQELEDKGFFGRKASDVQTLNFLKARKENLTDQVEIERKAIDIIKEQIKESKKAAKVEEEKGKATSILNKTLTEQKGLLGALREELAKLEKGKESAFTDQQVSFFSQKIDELTDKIKELEEFSLVLPEIKSKGFEDSFEEMREKIDNGSKSLIQPVKKEFEELADFLAERFKKITEITIDALNAVSTIQNELSENGRVSRDNDIALLEEQKQFELQLAGDNERAKFEIQSKFDKESRKLKLEQAKKDKEQALFNIAINTAQGVTAALASLPPNIILAGIIGATGIAKTAIVSSREIPAFEQGTKGQKHKGLAFVNERYNTEGSELFKRDGKIFTLETGGPALVNFEKGTEVIGYDEMKSFDKQIPFPDVASQMAQSVSFSDVGIRNELMNVNSSINNLKLNINVQGKKPKAFNIANLRNLNIVT